MLSRIPKSPTILDKPKTMFSNFFSGTKTTPSKPPVPGIGEDEEDCLHDQSLHSEALTAIWRSPTSKLDTNEKSLLEALFTAYLSRTEALRTYQTTVLTLTDQLNDLRTSNSALKKQLDVTSQAHATLLTEITSPTACTPTSEDGRTSPLSEADDYGWWSDSGIDADEDDSLTSVGSPTPPKGLMRRGSSAGHWLRGTPNSPGEFGEVKLLKKENQRLIEEIERLEGVLEDCSMVLGGIEGVSAK